MEEHININLNDVSKFIEKEFAKDGANSLIPFFDTPSKNEFKKYLAERLAYLIDNNFELLVNTLYRIDVSEEKLSKLFSGDNRDHIPSKLADLIIERQIQKIIFRNKYKGGETREINE
jgi:hypothetical protein